MQSAVVFGGRQSSSCSRRAAAMREWFSAAELAGLPGLPTTARGANLWGKEGKIHRRKRSRGKGWEYHLHSLPERAQAALLLRYGDPAPKAPTEAGRAGSREHSDPEQPA